MWLSLTLSCVVIMRIFLYILYIALVITCS
ncbi:hypothetical protein CKAH01_15349 [Colletotrichum kahawae]|uniref:Uncharacterized protein n=1 Tax=Colletotrichum kahawae TaxID=34407 RepID=A0AAE0D7Y6_COLKA|nr:hypothetical protein CKAH01_15349 [Colletotrichum kahawae]